MSSNLVVLQSDSVNKYLNELSKEIKKEFGRSARVELLIAGGAAIMMTYSFRDSTIDIDAVISSRSSIKAAINRVGDKYQLPNGWLNSDFMRTESYSTKLLEHSRFYRVFNQVLSVRIVEPEYLIAMKLKAFRSYKKDISDIVGIIKEDAGKSDLSYEKVIRAVVELYGSMDAVSERAKELLQQAFESTTDGLYDLIRANEEDAKNVLVKFEEEYQDVLKPDNVEDVLSALLRRKEK